MGKNTVQTSLLIQNPNITITSVASFRNFIFVSAYGDKLLIYTIRRENESVSISEPRILEHYFNTKNGADEMIVDSIQELLLCRTSKGVYCADINDLNKKTLLANTEKCTCIALKVDCSKLCIGVRKKTLVYSVLSNRSGYRFVNYIPSKETPRCMEFLGDGLLVGCKIAYYLLNVEALSISRTLLPKCSKSNTYHLTVAYTSNPEILLLDSDNTIRMFDRQGMQTRSEEELIRITTQPLQLISLFPYLFVIVKNFLYIYNIVSLERIQRIPLDGQFHIVPNDDFATSSFLLHSTHNIYTLGLLSPEDQIHLLLDTNPPSFEQAIAVAVNHDLSQSYLNTLHCRYGFYLFSESLFEEAMNHFTQSGVSLENILPLFKELHLPMPSFKPSIQNDYPTPTLTPVSRRRAYEAFVSYLLNYREHVSSEDLPNKSEVQCILDTSIVFTWISLQAADSLKTFLLNKNYCNIQLVEERLVESIQTAMTEKSRLLFSLALLYLFEGKHQYKRAVEVILFQLQQYRSTSPERTQLLEILTHVLYGLDSSDESLVFKCSEKIYEEQPGFVIRCFVDEEGMIGHLNIYHVVQHLLDLAKNEETVYKRNKLALEYLKVVVPHFSSLPSNKSDHNLCHQLVIMYIQSIRDLSGIGGSPRVIDGGDSVPSSKEEDGRVDGVDSTGVAGGTDGVDSTGVAGGTDEGDSTGVTDGRNSTTDNSYSTHMTNEIHSLIQTLQEELQSLLQSNSPYIPSAVLEALPEDSMFYERCMVYAKMHCHEEALRLMLFTLEDCEGAYTYCKETYAKGEPEDTKVFLVMLKILLQPHADDKPDLVEKYANEASILIDRYHSYLDAEEVLSLFPDTTPFQDLFAYTSQAITELTEQMYNTRMKYNLTMSDYLDSQHHVAITRQNGVEVNETSVCSHCGKSLGTAAIVWISDSELYHYTCCKVEGDELLLKDKRTGMVERIPISHSTI